jgi:hypothetical protein
MRVQVQLLEEMETVQRRPRKLVVLAPELPGAAFLVHVPRPHLPQSALTLARFLQGS